MLFFDGLLCSRIGQNQCCTRCVWYCEALFQIAHFCNKFQVKLFLFQWFGQVFLSSSSPKVGICPAGVIFICHHSYDLSQFCESLTNTATNYRTCYKTIRCSHTSSTQDVIFHWISAAHFWLQNFNRILLKERNMLEIFVKEQCFEKQCFDNKTWKVFSSVMDRPMFLNINKTFCHLGCLGTWNLIDVFSKVFTG